VESGLAKAYSFPMFDGITISALIKVAEKIYNRIGSRWTRRSELRLEFSGIVTRLNNASVDYEVNDELKNLRDFFYKNSNLLKNLDVSRFNDLWLRPRAIEIKHGTTGDWSDKDYRRMLNDLDRIRL
jgi:hypothetical protein